MNFSEKLSLVESTNHSQLCIGLDTDLTKIPAHIRRADHPLLAFNRAIIEATSDLVSTYKLNIAFYEQYGEAGLHAIRETLKCIPDHIITIADAKRGDIGNTSAAYAAAFFEYFSFDAITVNPYLGFDSVQPFLQYPDKMVFLLALTSNQGSEDFQRLMVDGRPLYRHVMKKSLHWATHHNLGYVVGATYPQELAELRELAPDRLFLIPGIGTQGGDARTTMEANGGGPAMVNVSRAIIYASGEEDFAERAREAAIQYRDDLTPAS